MCASFFGDSCLARLNRRRRTESCAYACKAQASARVDVPTTPMTLKYTVEHADDGSGMCKAEYASDDAHGEISPSIVGGYTMPGIMFGMDQKESNSSDEVQSKRREMSVEDDLQIDPIMDEY